MKVEYIVCEYCDKSVGCPMCKQANHPESVQEMLDDAKIKEAITVSPAEGKKEDFQKISLEYPIKENVNLAFLYSASKSNKNMARLSSEALRKKLLKEGKLTDFHLKVWDGVQKNHCVVITEVKQRQNMLGSHNRIN